MSLKLNFSLKLTVFLFFAALSGQPAHGQIGPDPYYKPVPQPDGATDEPPPPQLEELEENSAKENSSPAGDGLDEEVDETELSLSFAEKRERFLYGFSLDIGTTRLRELVAFSYYAKYERNLFFTTNVGTGRWTMDGEQKRKTYRMKTDAKDLGFGVRYFFTEITGFYLESNLTYLFWRGGIKPTGSHEDREDSLASKLDSSFSATGPALGLKVGWMTAWENGFNMDYCLIGMAKPFLFSEDYTKNSSEARRAVRKELEKAQIWGLINVSVGWFF